MAQPKDQRDEMTVDQSDLSAARKVGSLAWWDYSKGGKMVCCLVVVKAGKMAERKVSRKVDLWVVGLVLKMVAWKV